MTPSRRSDTELRRLAQEARDAGGFLAGYGEVRTAMLNSGVELQGEELVIFFDELCLLYGRELGRAQDALERHGVNTRRGGIDIADCIDLLVGRLARR